MLWSHREFSPKSPKSHTPLGLRAFQPRSLLVVGDVKSLIPASFPAAAPSSWLTSVPRAAGGAAGSLGAEAATAKIKQRETSHFFVSAPASGKWQRTGGRQTKQGVPGQKKKKNALLTSEAFPCFLSPPLKPLSLPILAAPLKTCHQISDPGVGLLWEAEQAAWKASLGNRSALSPTSPPYCLFCRKHPQWGFFGCVWLFLGG